MDRVAFEKEPDGSETASPSGTLGTRSGQSQCKGPEAGACSACPGKRGGVGGGDDEARDVGAFAEQS